MDLHPLTLKPESARNEQWEKDLVSALAHGKLLIENPEPQIGPDGWPYLLVRSGPKATEPAPQVLHWLSERGLGLGLNTHKVAPDYILTYGMVWNFRERGEFLSPTAPVTSGQVQFAAGQKVLAGAPSPEYLPDYVRAILRQFFADQGCTEPRILVMGMEGAANFDLCFSLESLGHPPDSEHAGIAEAIGWFLPQHYSLVLISENGLPPFVAL